MRINESLVAASDTTLQKKNIIKITIKHDNGIETKIKELRRHIYVLLLTLVS